MGVKEWIVKWFEENGNVSMEELKQNADKNYVEEGFVDSFGFITLIGACEEEFSIRFSDQDFEGEEIFTIQGLAELIERMQGQEAPHE